MSAFGTFETSADVRYTAAFGGKADISQRLPDDRDFMSTRPSSAASSGKRSRLFSAYLGSNAMFLPSVQPSSLSPSMKIDQVFDMSGAPAVNTPIR
jgi:hypothetical protein